MLAGKQVFVGRHRPRYLPPLRNPFPSHGPEIERDLRSLVREVALNRSRPDLFEVTVVAVRR